MSDDDDPVKAQKTDYRDVRDVGVDEGKRERLYEAQTECCVMWTNRDGWPIGVMHRFVWRDERFWVTCTAERKRVPALRARPQSCVVVSSEGTWLGGDITTTAATMATVHDDAATKAWFFPALAERQRRGDDAAAEEPSSSAGSTRPPGSSSSWPRSAGSPTTATGWRPRCAASSTTRAWPSAPAT